MKPYYEDEKAGIQIWHGDCREIITSIGLYVSMNDLVITDPPYGINENADKVASRGKLAAPKDYGQFYWDRTVIDQRLIENLISCGRYACIFGGNYYVMKPSSCWLVWDKMNGDNDFADCELAWTNYPKAVRMKKHLWNGMIRKDREERYHPTQKPLEVISWAIKLCPEPCERILDPFMGSGTTLRAAKDLGKKAIGIDIEEKYCEIAAKRLSQEVFNFEPQGNKL